jgi:hypothetical protein
MQRLDEVAGQFVKRLTMEPLGKFVPSERKPPTPVCKSFVACRQIFLDQFAQEYIILAPTHQIASLMFPVVVTLSIFGRFTSVQGSYHLELQLQDLEGNTVWRQIFEQPWELRDPLAVGTLVLNNLGIYFQKPGKYEWVLFANGDEVFRDVFFAAAASPPQPPT